MLIQGCSISHTVLRDADAANRFWYWHGASGKRYIHSVYPADLCPPLPGAVYIAVKRAGPLRIALDCGRFPPIWAMLQGLDCDEVHVHLLAQSDAEARSIQSDLALALRTAHETDMAA